MKKILVPIAPGFEEIEAVTVIDVLRRAGAEVVVAGTVPGVIRASRGVQVVPDTTLDTVRADDLEAIVLPGGALGAENLRSDPRIACLLRELSGSGKTVAAICAAPAVLAAAGLLVGKRATSHPAVRAEIGEAGAIVLDEVVVEDGQLITSQAAGTAMAFALWLVRRFFGPEKVAEINVSLLAPTPSRGSKREER